MKKNQNPKQALGGAIVLLIIGAIFRGAGWSVLGGALIFLAAIGGLGAVWEILTGGRTVGARAKPAVKRVERTAAMSSDAKIVHPTGDEVVTWDTSIIPSRCDRVYKARSESTKGVSYDVNVKQLTCTCPDFTENRMRLQQNDVRRICKHIRAKLEQVKVMDLVDDHTRALLRNPNGRFHRIAVDDVPCLCSYNTENAWVRVYATIGDKTISESYNLAEKRWSYGRPPAIKQREIESALAREFKLGA